MFFKKQNQRIKELEKEVDELKDHYWYLSNELETLKTKKGKGKK
jgi:molecular chaperone GrpE (heat shock protein)